MADLSNAQQDALIRASWPGFRTVMAGKRLAIWRGAVQGLSHRYEVKVLYARNRRGDPFRYDYAWFPEVTVLDPPLCARADDPLDPIPHVYNDITSDQPILCLFDPRDDGWSRDQAIADTILVWTASWLRFYEAWHATGVWTGGSAPHGHRALHQSDRADEDVLPYSATPVRGRQALFTSTSNHALLPGLADADLSAWSRSARASSQLAEAV